MLDPEHKDLERDGGDRCVLSLWQLAHSLSISKMDEVPPLHPPLIPPTKFTWPMGLRIYFFLNGVIHYVRFVASRHTRLLPEPPAG